MPKINLKKKERSGHRFFVPKLPHGGGRKAFEDLFGKKLNITKSLNGESTLLPSS